MGTGPEAARGTSCQGQGQESFFSFQETQIRPLALFAQHRLRFRGLPCSSGVSKLLDRACPPLPLRLPVHIDHGLHTNDSRYTLANRVAGSLPDNLKYPNSCCLEGRASYRHAGEGTAMRATWLGYAPCLSGGIPSLRSLRASAHDSAPVFYWEERYSPATAAKAADLLEVGAVFTHQPPSP